MGSTYLSLHYHLVFGTKNREPFIAAEWRPRLHEYLGGAIAGLGGVPQGSGAWPTMCICWSACEPPTAWPTCFAS